jgi:hypothetical protein
MPTLVLVVLQVGNAYQTVRDGAEKGVKDINGNWMEKQPALKPKDSGQKHAINY